MSHQRKRRAAHRLKRRNKNLIHLVIIGCILLCMVLGLDHVGLIDWEFLALSIVCELC